MADTPPPESPDHEPSEAEADSDRIDEASDKSFPASDPPGFWAGDDEPKHPGRDAS